MQLQCIVCTPRSVGADVFAQQLAQLAKLLWRNPVFIAMRISTCSCGVTPSSAEGIATVAISRLCQSRLPKQRRSLDTYHRILRAAQECVAESGYSKTSTQEVARRAEISHGGLFKRFPTKVSLMASMVGYVEAQARKMAVEHMTEELMNSSMPCLTARPKPR